MGPGFNVICGQNNAGKTALLESLDPITRGVPHRSLVSVPTRRISPNPTSWLNVSFFVSRAELLEMLREQEGSYILPVPTLDSPFAGRIGYQSHAREDLQKLVNAFLEQKDFTFRLRKEVHQNGTTNWFCPEPPSFGLYHCPTAQTYNSAAFQSAVDGSIGGITPQSTDGRQDIGTQLVGAFHSRVYRFSAERMTLGSCRVGVNPNLSPNASNLAEVLNMLQGNTAQFAYFNSLLHEVLPNIHQVSVAPPSQDQVEIRVWTVDPSLRRLDLTLPLSQCGTGIGQILAILYVTLLAASPQVIIIDEPQSFLHPGAIRKMVQVLKTHSEHQYIIATHSPTVISASEPSTVNVCRIAEGVATVERIDPGEAKDLRAYLAEVGARLSDVFGADNILWVEGRTEELCFPKILEGIAGRRLRGTSILAVSNTGELENRDAERVFEMYNRLSSRNSLLPPAIGFIFDSECRSEAQKRELIHRSRDLLRFLPRRMYENYLLNPRAVAAIANEVDGFRTTPVSPEEVEAAIREAREDSRLGCPSAAEVFRHGWVAGVDGARLLGHVFNRLSETRVCFDKLDHSIRLTEWLIQNSPNDLEEVSNLIVSCLPVN